MKNSNILKIFTLLFALTVVTSCVEDDDFDTPDTTVVEANIEGTIIGIDELYGLWEQSVINQGESVLTFEESDLYITGYVVSSDEGGNFFEELVIQDAPSNSVRGVRVLVDVNPLFTTYEFGRKVFIKLDGLILGVGNGVLTLGFRNGNTIEKIAESLLEEYVVRDTVVAEITPRELAMSEFAFTVDDNNFESIQASLALTNQYIRLNDVQFNRDQALGEDRLTFAAESSDQFDGERVLESCEEGLSAVFSTSTFADFKAVLLPSGRGTLDGILSLDFFGETFNVVVNDPTSINLVNEDRCDPEEVDCGLADTTGSNVIFEEFFESFTNGQTISGNGWTNFIQEGTNDWEAFFSDSGSVSLGISARIGSVQSGDSSSISWLITPEVNFDAQDGETIEFKTSNSFADGSILEILFSSDWDGNPDNVAAATWSILPSAYIVQDDDFFVDWFDSETVDLSCIQGSGYIAWRFTGSGDADFDGTYELDEIEIRSN